METILLEKEFEKKGVSYTQLNKSGTHYLYEASLEDRKAYLVFERIITIHENNYREVIPNYTEVTDNKQEAIDNFNKLSHES